MEFDQSYTTATALGIILVAYLWYWLQMKPCSNFPPGPKGWPLIGNLLEFTKKAPHHVFMDLAEKYGNVLSVRIGSNWTVVLNGSDTIKEALIKNAVEFAGRPNIFSMNEFSKGGQDIAFGPFSPTWALHRKLAHSAFRNLATGNNERFENLIFSMTPKVAEVFEQKGNKPFDPKNVVSLAIYNFLAQMVFGKQYKFDDPELLEWRNLSQEGIELFGNGLMADFIPFMRYVPTSGLRGLRKLIKRFSYIITKEFDHHKATFDPKGEPRDMIDMLFLARQKMVDDGDEGIEKITEEHIRQTITDVYSAGTDTSIFTMHWAIALLVDHPEVQEKVQKEIDEIIGHERNPRMSDRGNLPYTECALYECLRYSSIVPLSLPHAITKDVTFHGYFIPKGTWVLPNLYSMHYEKKLWNDPETFRPEHFLDQEGKIRQHPDGFMPFSAGRRVCLGESLAKAELFLIFTWLFQNYSFTKPVGNQNIKCSDVDPTAMNPLLAPYEVIATKRS